MVVSCPNRGRGCGWGADGLMVVFQGLRWVRDESWISRSGDEEMRGLTKLWGQGRWTLGRRAVGTLAKDKLIAPDIAI